MTPAVLQAIHSTFEVATTDPQAFMTEFRRRALKLDPSLRSALPPADRVQSATICAAIDATLADLDSGTMVPAVAERVAKVSRLIGIQPGQFGAIGQALLGTLAAYAGAAFTDTVRSAWADLYVLVAEALMSQRYNHMDLVA